MNISLSDTIKHTEIEVGIMRVRLRFNEFINVINFKNMFGDYMAQHWRKKN